MLIFIKPEQQQLRMIKLVFDIFGRLSGLKVNIKKKSELLVIIMSMRQVQYLASIMQCKPTTCPIKYLGLPLSDKKLSKQQYKLLIDEVQDTLPR
jgi:hypothetical protein